MSDETKSSESQAASVPSAPAPAILNTSRIARLQEFKPALRTVYTPPAAVEEIKPLNPDLHPDDVRICIDIRIETRFEVIHERTAKDHSCKYLLQKGKDLLSSLTEFSHAVGEVSEGGRKSYSDWLRLRHPEWAEIEKQKEQSPQPIRRGPPQSNEFDMIDVQQT